MFRIINNKLNRERLNLNLLYVPLIDQDKTNKINSKNK